MLIEKKKIVFLIGASENKDGIGVGGHYYSLKSIITSLKDLFEIIVINTNPNDFSPVLNEIYGIKKYFIKHKTLWITLLKIYQIVKFEEPDVLHSFDDYSLLLYQFITYFTKIPHINTKAGGKNYNIKGINSIILFSKENEIYLRKLNTIENIFFIPNRIPEINPDEKRISNLKLYVKVEDKIFLRISRIDPYYEKTFNQSIKLVNKLNLDGVKCKLIILGAIRDQNYYKQLKKQENENIHIITDEKFTSNASQLINIADFAVGTGRGYMEASYFGKVLLAPCFNTEIPVLIDEDNFNKAAIYNFSERLILESIDKKLNYINIKKSIENQEFYQKLSKFNKEMSKKHFIIEDNIKNKYKKIYKNLRYSKVSLFFIISKFFLYLRKDFIFYFPEGRLRNLIIKLWGSKNLNLFFLKFG